DAEDLADDLEMFHDKVHLLPAWETLPFEHVSPNVPTMAQRSVARYALRTGGSGTVVVSSVRAATQRLSPSAPDPLCVSAGSAPGFDTVVEVLAGLGYHRTDRVETRGEFAVRGGIVDVAPAQGGDAVRIEFWGDDVDDLRTFNLGSQRATGPVDRTDLFPARELRVDDALRTRAAVLRDGAPWAVSTWDRIAEGLSFPGIESWLPWLADAGSVAGTTAANVVLFDPVRSEARADELQSEETSLAEALAPTWGGTAPPASDHPRLYRPLDVPAPRTIEAPAQPAGPADEGLELRALDATPGDAVSVAAALEQWRGRDVTVIVAMDGEPAAARAARLITEAGLGLPVRERLEKIEAAVLATGIHRGFVAPQLGVGVVGEQEVAGRRRSHRRAVPRVTAPGGVAYRDLQPGDFVVHHHHGIGRFEGLVHREIAGVERDYLLLAYHGADRLYVPTDQLVSVRRYTGGESPRLSRLGGTDWSATRSKVRQAVALVAEEVVDLHRKRAAATGHAFDPDTPWQREFEASFPYEETPDQLTAIADVKQDMERQAPMDRLVFGDVGFGKTEVALRGAFKAVQEGRQVAALVPTTLLAQQHHATFSERLASYPMRVEVLSRFLTPRQQKDVIAGLADGTVDLVVGTHRLLSEDVVFKDLGLLIVDEEQRFGVGAKDKLKRLRTSVDVITLTATPIPRTLELVMTGIRDVSHIRTAPEDRHPILTYVGPYDEHAVSAAIRREMLREGQVYFVHNRIQSIDHAVARLRELVPDARFGVVHGRMSEGGLEQVMFDFWNREFDVLVATTIIESGLDLPQVNTLIVERADRLGLAQLYQLRGRVGRSSQRAYAYLFHPPDQTLGEDAYRRLEAIGEYSDLGSGFELAMRDLEIRGAGSILGETQAGHVAAVGLDLYVELVSDAVAELRGDQGVAAAGLPEVRIDLPVDAHLPAEYVPSSDQRLEAYRKLAAAATFGEIEDIATEWRDRYGALPDRATALLAVARLRLEAIRIGLTEVVKLRDEIRLGPVTLSISQSVRLERLQRRAVVRTDQVFIPVPRGELLASLTEFLRTMWPPADE
ncbi:MAG: transcription-repair coupling factor, partial [Acidimicrobiia bacterium]